MIQSLGSLNKILFSLFKDTKIVILMRFKQKTITFAKKPFYNEKHYFNRITERNNF